MTMYKRIYFIVGFMFLLTACNLDQARPLSKVSATESLVVAWVDGGNLIVRRSDEEIPRRIASGGVIRPYIAPDGERIAFTRGPNGRAETLWIVDSAGVTEMLLVGDGNPRIFRNGQSLVGDVVWFDETTLYINTLKTITFSTTANDDLYRVNVRTGEIALILPASEGGRIFMSPDGESIATVSAGTYGRQDAQIRVVDPLAIDGATNLLFYIGVATGSETVFHPHLQWLSDSQSLIVAIPDVDLIYSETDADDTVPPTRLWQLPVDTPSDRNLLGSVRASFFGLPVWSDDVSQMVYLRRSLQSNQFTIVFADANGDNPIDYLSGESGTIEQPRWLPDSTQFTYTSKNPGNVMLGERNTEPQPLSQELVFSPHFVSNDLYVYVTSVRDQFQMRFARIHHQSVDLGIVGATIPLFDAVLVSHEVAG